MGSTPIRCTRSPIRQVGEVIRFRPYAERIEGSIPSSGTNGVISIKVMHSVVNRGKRGQYPHFTPKEKLCKDIQVRKVNTKNTLIKIVGVVGIIQKILKRIKIITQRKRNFLFE